MAEIKLDRRTLLIGAGGVGLAAALAPGLSTLFGGGSSSGLRYVQAKREVVDYFTKVAADYNATGPAHPVRMESQAGSLTNGFVRNSNQPAVVNSNFNNEIKLYVEAGALRDLSDRPAVETLRPDHIEFFRSLANFNDEMSVLPFSVTAAGTIYNKELFAQAGVEIPTTWDEFIAACETFKSKDIVPILGTYADTWTIDLQFGYHMCSTMDVAAFFQAVGDAGVDLGPDSAYSFEKDLPPACERLLTLLSYFQDGFQRVGYDQGNQQFAGGAAAMYFQGPWAFTALNNINPDAKEIFGTFATPGASAADTKVSAGLDLCVWIPRIDQWVGARRRVGVPRPPHVTRRDRRLQRGQPRLLLAGRRAAAGRPAGQRHHAADGRRPVRTPTQHAVPGRDPLGEPVAADDARRQRRQVRTTDRRRVPPPRDQDIGLRRAS